MGSKNKKNNLFECEKCGAQSKKWQGQCYECGSWNTLTESSTSDMAAPVNSAMDNSTLSWLNKNKEKPQTLDQSVKEEQIPRLSTDIKELDSTLSGGLVPGSLILLGGMPGVGKSTLLLQMAQGLGIKSHKLLYITAEESVKQTALRAKRLNVNSKNITVASENELHNILELIKTINPEIVVIDSIQTIYNKELNSPAGTPTQIKSTATTLMQVCKQTGLITWLVGHITKEGDLAGPKLLEHMVDTVLSFEGDENNVLRLLRVLKNRFGRVDQLGVFSMQTQGLTEVKNPSELFIKERNQPIMGACAYVTTQGARNLLCEIQALSTMNPSNPRRANIGGDTSRLNLLVAVMEKYLRIDMSQDEIFVSVVGGLKVSEAASDLAILAALYSTHKALLLPPRILCLGEVGLTGEFHPCRFAENKLMEAQKLGVKKAILPKANQKGLADLKFDIEIHWIKHVTELPLILQSIGLQRNVITNRDEEALPELRKERATSSELLKNSRQNNNNNQQQNVFNKDLPF